MARSHALESATLTKETSVHTARKIVAGLFGPPAQRTFRVRYWDGSAEGPPSGNTSRFTLILKYPGTLRRMLLPPSDLALGEAYLRDDFDVEGSMEAATGLADVLAERLQSPLMTARSMATLLPRLMSLPTNDTPTIADEHTRQAPDLTGRRHSRERDATAVRFHYDVGNDFYALWLDQRMVYSCAYFLTGEESLDEAQTAKLDYICRKLRLKPGENLLDIGCGWGGLVMYASEHYDVQATGITLSEPQAALARERIERAGLSDRCKVEVRDYRDLPRKTTFDKVVSVGMVEHVGRAKLPTYFAEAYRLLKPGGLFLNHGIVTTAQDPGFPTPEWAMNALLRRGSFNERYVFPDGELLPPGEVIGYAERAGFETRDVESLREHYAMTLRHWVRRLEARHDEAARLVGEQTYRVWRLYMSAAARGFATGSIGIIQTLLTRQDKSGAAHLPLTRGDLYQRHVAQAPQGGTS